MLLADALRRQSVSHGQRLRMVGDAEVLETEVLGGVGHLVQAGRAVAGRRVVVKDALDIADRDQLWQGVILGGHDLARVLA